MMRINTILAAVKRREIVQSIILFLFFIPLFFQLSGNIFTDTGFNFDAKGSLLLTPLPIACITCFIGIVALLRWDEQYFGIDIIFVIFILSMFSVLITAASSDKAELAKFVLLIQFLVPMFGFVLGQLYIEPEAPYLKLEAIILYILAFIIPAQVISTLNYGPVLLVPDVGLFSLYQHLQYLPTVFVGLYFFTIVGITEQKLLKGLSICLAPFLGIYIAASLSLSTVLFTIFLIPLTVIVLWRKQNKIFAGVLVTFICSAFFLYYPVISSIEMHAEKFGQKSNEGISTAVISEQPSRSFEASLRKESDEEWAPLNIRERFVNWNYYTEALGTNATTILFGHEDRPERTKYPSAHNYYLDFAYHFGILALSPLLYLIGITIYRAVKALLAKEIALSSQVLLVIVLFFLLVDNSVKVGLKQPYPGLIMFFLWGRLLQILNNRLLGKGK